MLPSHRMNQGFRILRTLPLILATLLVVTFCRSDAYASSVKVSNLESMVQSAGEVFVGTCLAVQPSQIKFQGQFLPVTRYRFWVSESLKGGSSKEHILVQMGWPSSLTQSRGNTTSRLPLVFDGMPEYMVGREYILLLTAPSTLGLSSPIGMQQSVFQSWEDKFGNKSWESQIAQPELLTGISIEYRPLGESEMSPAKASNRTKYSYQEFIGLIRKLVLATR